nr:RNA-directed DNA polymerase, eukaryota, reverse transcriptase zinc-binding domain protein [Tanacetum cinerariifolium]
MNFKTKFPRVYALESDKKITVASKMNHNDVGVSLRRAPRDGVELEQFNSLNVFLIGKILSYSNNRWSWSLVGSGEFLVASVRKLIDEHRLGGSSHKTCWIHTVPIQINILAWKVWYDFLPTRLNLSHRGIDNDIYSTVDACSNACEMWKAIERLKQGESINVQDLETNLYWEFGKFTSQDDESLESYLSRFYKMMNELIRNQCKLNAEQADWKDDTDDDELEDQELEAHYMYMVQLQEVSPDVADS